MNIEKLLANIEAAEEGPQIAALFDFDGTIMAGYSATVFLQDSLASGDLKPDELVQITRALTSFGLGNMGFSALMAIHAQYLQGQSEADYTKNSEKLFRKKIARLIYPESRALIDAHRAKGHTIAIISSATPYQVQPAAQDLDIEHVYCTGLEVKRGKFTGKVVKPTVFGEGKVIAAETLAKKTGARLESSFFYSDSTDDIQLLEHVGHPVTLNPSKRLKKITEERAWPTATFDSRGKISLNRFIRSIAATGSLVGSFAAGLPIYALTRSKRDSLNFSISLFADTCNALIGLDIEVVGEENLWSHRPAVFMFNHQSKADVAIMASLVRRDVVGVGKKEIQKTPVIGWVMGMAGTVFIDRSDREKAIESMKPLVSAMKDEKKSLIIAPEGTRTPTRKLAPFKKGGFHMAMQVGVPIIPVVIHNASDIAPKGDFVFKPGTVHVEVLPPVDTSDWTTNNMNEQVNLVRNQFLKALGQPEQTVKEIRAAAKDTPEDMIPGSKPSKRRPSSRAAKQAQTSADPSSSKPKKSSKTKPSTKAKPKTKAATKPKTTAKTKVRVQQTPAKKTATKSADANKKATAKSTPVKKQQVTKSAAKSKKAAETNKKKNVAAATKAKTKTKAAAKKIRTPRKKVAPKLSAAVKPKLAGKD